MLTYICIFVETFTAWRIMYVYQFFLYKSSKIKTREPKRSRSQKSHIVSSGLLLTVPLPPSPSFRRPSVLMQRGQPVQMRSSTRTQCARTTARCTSGRGGKARIAARTATVLRAGGAWTATDASMFRCAQTRPWTEW